MPHALSDGYVLRVTSGPSRGQMVSLDRLVTVGRDGDLTIEDSTISRRHAQIVPGENCPSLLDLGSSAGTLLNDTFVERAELAPGDHLTMGRTTLMVLRLLRFSDAASGPAIRIHQGGKSRAVTLHEGLTIGRDSSADLVIADPTVSRRHAVIHLDDEAVTVEDLRSANGTRIDGEVALKPVRLLDGATIQVGQADAQLTFHAGSPSMQTSVRVAVEGESSSEHIEITAGPGASVAQVTAELGRALGAPTDGLVLYRPDEGTLHHPDDSWLSTGVRSGDSLVVGIGDATTLTPATGRRWPAHRNTRLNQLPRTVWQEPTREIAKVDLPEGTSFKGRGVIWQIAGGLGAVLIGLTLALVNPSYAIFGLITGGIGIISIAASILGEQSRRRYKVKEFHRRLSILEDELQATCLQQEASLDELYPSMDEIESWVRNASSRLWERRPDHSDALHLRTGIGHREARVRFERSRSDESPLEQQLDDVKNAYRYLNNVPVTVPGPSLGSLGVTGQTSRTRALLERMVIEAAAQHAPSQLSIWIAGTDSSWEWARWLPHVDREGLSSDPSAAIDVLAAAARALGETHSGDAVPRTELHLVVVTDPGVRFDLTKLVPLGTGRGLVVVAATESRLLPSGLACVLDISGDGRGSVTGVFEDAPVGDLVVDGITDIQAERIAIELNRVGGGSQRPAPSGLVELLGLGSVATLDVAAAWGQPTASLTVPIGSDDSGDAVTVGLRRDGPHAMIAGTTGSGKSELLQTILAAEVLRHRPEQLNLFMIDFKGGATFSPLADLPHVVGLVTDLEHDSSLAGRAFTSLDAEIARRKRVLDQAGVPDIKAYERSAPDDGAELPNLVVVIDEFALLVERQPEVKERLDTIATQGRSLGIHMILATQSPSGVITHSIRTNTNLWICLRVVTDSESVEILGARDAARISDRSPGRAIIRIGAGSDLRQFQAARIGRPVPAEDSPVTVRRLSSNGGDQSSHPVANTMTELDMVVKRITEAAERLGCAPQAPLWLDPLPAHLSPEDLLKYDRLSPDVAQHDQDHLRTTVGLRDDPSRHEQSPLVVDLSASGHMLVVGVYGSGKSTTLRQIGLDLAKRHSPDDLHIYAIDGGAGDLRQLVQLPHVGDVVAATDGERVTRLIERIDRVVTARRESGEIADRGGFVNARRESNLPWTVLMVDDFAVFREVAEGTQNGRLLERFNGLLQSGPAVGVHIVIATTQGVDLRTRELNLVQAKLALRSADPSDYALVDPRFTPAHTPPPTAGRGLVAGLLEVQVASPGDEAIAQLADSWANPTSTTGWPPPVRRLPDVVAPAQLDEAFSGVALGIGGDEVETVFVELSKVSPVLLIAGPRQSGRSTALTHMRAALIRSGRSTSLVLAPRPGPWADLPDEPDTAAGNHEVIEDPALFSEALDRLTTDTPSSGLLVIDDAEALAGVPGVAEKLDRIVRRAAELDLLVLMGARVNDLPGLFEPWARYVVSLRHVVLLQPSPDDLFLFGQKLASTAPQASVPGRGVLVDSSGCTVVQVAQVIR